MSHAQTCVHNTRSSLKYTHIAIKKTRQANKLGGSLLPPRDSASDLTCFVFA